MGPGGENGINFGGQNGSDYGGENGVELDILADIINPNTYPVTEIYKLFYAVLELKSLPTTDEFLNDFDSNKDGKVTINETTTVPVSKNIQD